MSDVEHGGQQVLIEKRGRPVAALVSVEDLSRLSPTPRRADRQAGALALVGAWAELEDQRLEALVDDIYRLRESDVGRITS